MDAALKKILKAVTLELRHLLEGQYDAAGKWQPGDLEQRLAALGVRGDRESAVVDELGHLADEDKHARKIVDAYIQLREEAGVPRTEAVAEFVRETAYTWANRLLALRCMEARELIDEVILQKEAYGGRSLEHHRLAQREPEHCTGEDDGRFVMLQRLFAKQAEHLPMLFDPQSPGVALRPSPAVLKQCIALLSGTATVRSYEPATGEVFTAPDSLGWAYQYWNTEEKDRVFEKVRTQMGAKIEGADIIPATQLYTESYMVQFLVQNSLGATWLGMHPDSRLCEQWDYYVRDADRAPVEIKPVRELTFLDPACGSGHFLLEAFDLLYAMYEEEGELTEPEAICDAILTQNLYGIDIDARAVQIAEVALWMKAAERAIDYEGVPSNLVAAVSSHLKGPHWDEFLTSFDKEPSVARVLRKFGESLEHIDELGSLARPNEDLKKIIAEEHTVWEQQVREQKEANYLFPEMRKDAVSGKLAFSEISDEEFGDRLFYRARAALDAFTEQARERGEFQDQFLGSEATTGFKLLETMGRKYDVVAANPPYMGSKNMGPQLKLFVESHFKPGKRDLYAAFTIRASELVADEGRLAMVTQQSWMFMRLYAAVRVNTPQDKGGWRGLLHKSIECLAHLGPGAFREIGGEVVNVALFVVQNADPPNEMRLTAVRVVDIVGADAKAHALSAGCRDSSDVMRTTATIRALRAIPEAPVLYWLTDALLDTFLNSVAFKMVADARPGLQTGNNDRHLRNFWEVNTSRCGPRWFAYAKGGEYRRWMPLVQNALDWESSGSRIKAEKRDRLEMGLITANNSRCWNQDYYFREGVNYTDVSKGAIGVRRLPGYVMFDIAGPGVFSDEWPPERLAGLLNSRVASFLLRFVSPNLHFSPGYVNRLPMAKVPLEQLDALAKTCLDLGEMRISLEPDEYSFTPSRGERQLSAGLVEFWLQSFLRSEHAALVQLMCEAAMDEIVETAYGLDSETKALMDRTVGIAVCEFPRLSGDQFHQGVDLPTDLNIQSGQLTATDSITDTAVRDAIIAVLRNESVEADAESASEMTQDDEDAESEMVFLPIPSTSVVESVSRALGIHPLSVFTRLNEVTEESFSSSTECSRRIRDHVIVKTLQVCGHFWPTESKNTETSPDVDGIIPVTQLPSLEESSREKTASDRVLGELQKFLRLSSVSRIEQDFASCVGESIAKWIREELFSDHVSRYGRRPIIWQVQSTSTSTRVAPAYSVFVYYHKLDGDLIRKSRKQAEDVRKSFATELRGIESTPVDARSDRQEQRRIYLDGGIGELQRFDDTLAQLVQSGFGPESLVPVLCQYAIDDAILALKARWLRRFNSFLTDMTLADWQSAATAAEIHDELPGWIAQAVTHLQHHCATVGIKPPKAKDVGDEPTSADLAPLICSKANEMLSGSLKCACDVWWKQFDETVLGPLKEQVKEMKNERKEIKAKLEGEPSPEPDDVTELTLRDRDLREDIKPIEKKIKRLKAKATVLRKDIEAWTSDEPLTWELWLADQPLFDEVTSSDGHKAPPTTIAEFITQESAYIPDINDGVRVNIAPLQKAGILAADVLPNPDVDKAIADRAEWRADERRWVREGKLPQPGWWPEEEVT